MLRLLTLIAILFSTQVLALEFKGKFIQGHFIIGKTSPGTEIIIDKKKVKVSKDGYFAFGIEKDRKLNIIITEGDKTVIKKIQKRKYNIQKIEGLSKKKVTPPEEFYVRIKKENTIFKELKDFLKKKLLLLKNFMKE